MAQSKPSVKWGVGVELAPDHLGPVRFAATLTQTSPSDVKLALHVIPDQESLHPLVTHQDADAIRKRVIKDVAEIMIQEGLSGQSVGVELIEDDEVARGLIKSVRRLGLDGLIVGRRAKRDEDPLVRLGEVTRRILRRLPAPVIVVPPDYGDRADHGLGDGPVILGADLSSQGVAAAKFAQDLAIRLDRKLLLAHGTQAFNWGVSYIPAATITRIQDQARESANNKLAAWAKSNGITDAEQLVFMGDPAKHLLQLAYEKDAAVLVTGSRMLGPVERLFLASVSSEIAAAASCPVAVVPGGEPRSAG